MTHNSDYVDAGAAAIMPPGIVGDPPQRYGEGGQWVWLGHLAGFYLNGDYESNLYLEHAACGWQNQLPRGGFAVTHTSPAGYDYGTFLANVVVAALEHKCPERPAEEPEEESYEPCCEDADELSSHYHCAVCGERCSVMGHPECLKKPE